MLLIHGSTVTLMHYEKLHYVQYSVQTLTLIGIYERVQPQLGNVKRGTAKVGLAA